MQNIVHIIDQKFYKTGTKKNVFYFFGSAYAVTFFRHMPCLKLLKSQNHFLFLNESATKNTT